MLNLMAVALATALAAAPDPKVKLASTGLTCVGLPADKCAFYSDHYAQKLTERGLRVITSKEVAGILGAARAQQLAGCDESASNCLTELADALGVDGVVTGRVGLFGDHYEANVTVVSTGTARLLHSFSVHTKSERVLLDAFVEAARTGAPEIAARLNKRARHYGTNFLEIDALAIPLLRTGILKYERPVAQHWSVQAHVAITPAGTLRVNNNADVPTYQLDLGARARHYFLDLAPYGLFAGGGLALTTIHGVFTDQATGQLAGYSSAGGVASVEVGYQLVLFDWLALELSAVGFAGFEHFFWFDGNPATWSGNTNSAPLIGARILSGIGVAF